jgi:predicted transcriptional regulator
MEYRDNDPFTMSDELSNVGFTQLPLPILFDRNLTSDEKILYSLLLRFTGADGMCFPGVARLAKGLNVHPRSIQRYLSRLIDRGLIRRIERQNETNLYDLGNYRDVYGEGHNSGRLNDDTLESFRVAGEEKLVSRIEKTRDALADLMEDVPGSGGCSFIGDPPTEEDDDIPEYRPRTPVKMPGKRFEGVTEAIRAQEQRSLSARKRRNENRRKLSAKGRKPEPKVEFDSLNTGEVELGAPNPNKTTMNPRDFQIEWKLRCLEKFGFEPKWGPKESSQLKNIVNRFTDDHVSRDQVYESVFRIIDQWDDVSARYGIRGYPTIGLILSYSDSWVREQLHGKMEPNKRVMARRQRDWDGESASDTEKNGGVSFID